MDETSAAPPEGGGKRSGGSSSGGFWRWALGAVVLIAVGFALAPSEMEAARQLPLAMHHLEWAWVPAGLLAQAGVYVCLAGILAAALGALGFRAVPFRS